MLFIITELLELLFEWFVALWAVTLINKLLDSFPFTGVFILSLEIIFPTYLELTEKSGVCTCQC